MPTKQKMSTKAVVFSGICIAAATLLSEVKLLDLPYGGSITLLSMFFISLPGYFFGITCGLTSALAYGVLQFILGPYVVHPAQVFLDYGLGFTVLGVTGFSYLLEKISPLKNFSLHITFFIACLLRYASSVASGVIFFAEYTPEGLSPLSYSAVYNSYVLVEFVITAALLSIPAVKNPLLKVKEMVSPS